MAQERSRKHHTRSRDGCTTCRKRHVRCDETRPFWYVQPNRIEASLPDRTKYTRFGVSANDRGILSVNCTHHGRVCEYPSMVPLRERRAKKLPGQQQPFSLGSDQCLNVEMAQDDQLQRKSQWLSVLDLDAAQVPGASVLLCAPSNPLGLLNWPLLTNIYPESSPANNLSLTIHDPDSLRNTLLIAGLHYTWRVGDMRGYEQTYLFHKGKTIQQVNESLAARNTSSRFLHLIWGISTLCLIECSLGNTSVAEMHRDGLVSLMDMKYPRTYRENMPISQDELLAYQNLIYILHSIKSRIKGSKKLLCHIKSGGAADSPKLISLLKQWNAQGIGSLDMLMKTMLFIPFFQASSTEACFGNVDASSIIVSLRMLTDSASDLPSLSPEQLAYDPGWIWINGAASKLAFALVSSQVNAFPRRQKGLKVTDQFADADDENELFISSWCGIATASELYLDCILSIWNAGEPIECRVLRRMMLFLAQDLRETIQEVHDPATQDLWLWKTMVGACALEKYAHRSHDDGTLGSLVATFQSLLLIWSEKTCVVEWADAQSRLAKVAWPVMHPGTLHAGEDVWHKTVQLTRQPMQGGSARHDNAGKGEDPESVIMLFLSSLL
ncbi:unnamed protein product [Clonostachys rosea]|uniref:Zn(2)-C6 fungal-type domain-containing protein n=1 Tax=Bionectria ochroleuca TaxID=29856 RepID=A0ABY6TSX8_BIOOC|nr:unnamed protein product [Clonostachys rosea]